MSYKTLGETGTMAQSFHFEVTPQKSLCVPVARASNCVCMAGGKGRCTTGDCCQRSADCPELAKFCCPKGTIGRPKVYPNGYRFEYTRIGSHPEPWPPCPNKPRANAQIDTPCYNWKDYKWQDIYKPTKSMRPPVF